MNYNEKNVHIITVMAVILISHQATLIEFLIKAFSLQNVAVKKYVKNKYNEIG